MYKAVSPDIKKYLLDSSLYKLHKEGNAYSDFGMDNTSELIDDSFGIYSAVNLKEQIGPIKKSCDGCDRHYQVERWKIC